MSAVRTLYARYVRAVCAMQQLLESRQSVTDAVGTSCGRCRDAVMRTLCERYNWLTKSCCSALRERTGWAHIQRSHGVHIVKVCFTYFYILTTYFCKQSDLLCLFKAMCLSIQQLLKCKTHVCHTSHKTCIMFSNTYIPSIVHQIALIITCFNEGQFCLTSYYLKTMEATQTNCKCFQFKTLQGIFNMHSLL